MGHVEGRNLAMEYHSADYQQDRLAALAGDLVQRGWPLLLDSLGRQFLLPKPRPHPT